MGVKAMSTELGTLEDTGSRGVDMLVTRYGGGEAGMCIQLTAEMEDGLTGYIQISAYDMVRITQMLEVYDEQRV
jgi:hypothetical protein